MSYTIQYLQSEMAAQGLEVIVLVNCLVQDAIRLCASDLHIEPWETSVAVRARVIQKNGGILDSELPRNDRQGITQRYWISTF